MGLACFPPLVLIQLFIIIKKKVIFSIENEVNHKIL